MSGEVRIDAGAAGSTDGPRAREDGSSGRFLGQQTEQSPRYIQRNIGCESAQQEVNRRRSSSAESKKIGFKERDAGVINNSENEEVSGCHRYSSRRLPQPQRDVVGSRHPPPRSWLLILREDGRQKFRRKKRYSSKRMLIEVAKKHDYYSPIMFPVPRPLSRLRVISRKRRRGAPTEGAGAGLTDAPPIVDTVSSTKDRDIGMALADIDERGTAGRYPSSVCSRVTFLEGSHEAPPAEGPHEAPPARVEQPAAIGTGKYIFGIFARGNLLGGESAVDADGAVPDDKPDLPGAKKRSTSSISHITPQEEEDEPDFIGGPTKRVSSGTLFLQSMSKNKGRDGGSGGILQRSAKLVSRMSLYKKDAEDADGSGAEEGPGGGAKPASANSATKLPGFLGRRMASGMGKELIGADGNARIVVGERVPRVPKSMRGAVRAFQNLRSSGNELGPVALREDQDEAPSPREPSSTATDTATSELKMRQAASAFRSANSTLVEERDEKAAAKEEALIRMARIMNMQQEKRREARKKKRFRSQSLFGSGATMLADKIEYMEELTVATVNHLWNQPWRDPRGSVGCWAYWPVFHNENTSRQIWSVLFAIPLLYIATIFPYRLAFVELRVSPEWPFGEVDDASVEASSKGARGWEFFDYVVDGIFWADLILQFFFAYEGVSGELISHPKMIVETYTKTWFLPDFIACLPSELWTWLGSNLGRSNKMVRVGRLYRLTRLTRLGKLIKISSLAKITRVAKSNPIIFALMQKIGKSRILVILQMLIGLLALSHIFACGWYLVAGFHDNPVETWVWRRTIFVSDNDSGMSHEMRLVDAPPGEQWMHSLYYVLTVFTTVGFGDIAPFTMGELIFTQILMLLGAIVNSIIISEVIHVATRTDIVRNEIRDKCQAVERFCENTNLNMRTQRVLSHFAEVHTKTKYADGRDLNHHGGESVQWRDLVDIAEAMDGSFRNSIVRRVYGGLYYESKLLADCDRGLSPEMRSLPIVVAGFLVQQRFSPEEYLYMLGEQPKGIWLVMTGFASHVAVPSDLGGVHNVRTVSTLLKIPNAAALVRDRSYPYNVLGPRNYVGEWEVLYPRDRAASCRAETDVLTAFLSRTSFVTICHRFPSLAENLKSRAQRKEQRRRVNFGNHRYTHDFEKLSATIISVWWRAVTIRALAHRVFSSVGTLLQSRDVLNPKTGLSRWQRAMVRVCVRAERVRDVTVSEIMHDYWSVVRRVDDEVFTRSGALRPNAKTTGSIIRRHCEEYDKEGNAIDFRTKVQLSGNDLFLDSRAHASSSTTSNAKGFANYASASFLDLPGDPPPSGVVSGIGMTGGAGAARRHQGFLRNESLSNSDRDFDGGLQLDVADNSIGGVASTNFDNIASHNYNSAPSMIALSGPPSSTSTGAAGGAQHSLYNNRRNPSTSARAFPHSGNTHLDRYLMSNFRNLRGDSDALRVKLNEMFRMTQDLYFANFGREMG
ncbi:unnamed protein product [Amoebophrya sp. A25]|nr:unnamed protein product [Amoebophrya sp. A25]|eukprot:GSA25T00012164001.1